MDKKARTAITNAKSRAIIKDPWYGVIASRFTLIEDESVETMGVKLMRLGKVACYYAPSFVNELTLEELMAVFKHEIEHVLRSHLSRSKRFMKEKQHFIWNIAADWVINGPSNSKRIANLPEPGCFLPTKQNPGSWKNCDLDSLNLDGTTEEFVDWIFANTSYDEKVGKNGGLYGVLSDKKGNPIHVQGFDNHKVWRQSEASPEEMKRTAKNLARAATQAVGIGKVPGHLVEILKELDEGQHNWQYILRSACGRAAGGKRKTFSRRHRKKDKFGIKGISHRNSVKLVVGVDISGSMSTKMLQKVFAEIEGMMSRFKVTLITFDTEVRSINEYHKGDWKKIELVGRGGTNFKSFFEYIEEKGVVGKCNVVLTDGYDMIPEEREYYVVWAIVGKQGKEYVENQDIWGQVVLIEHDYNNDRW